jgi:hypothetical protein
MAAFSNKESADLRRVAVPRLENGLDLNRAAGAACAWDLEIRHGIEVERRGKSQDQR